MKGYVIIDAEIIDQEAHPQLIERMSEVVGAHGGRFIVRTSSVRPFEGGWEPSSLLILEFDSLDAAQGFVDSDQYSAIDEVRHRAVKSRIVVVEGYDSEA